MRGIAKFSLDNVVEDISETGRPNLSKDYELNTWGCIVCQVRGYKTFEPK